MYSTRSKSLKANVQTQTYALKDETIVLNLYNIFKKTNMIVEKIFHQSMLHLFNQTYSKNFSISWIYGFIKPYKGFIVYKVSFI